MVQTKNKFNTTNLYRLKRSFGKPIKLYGVKFNNDRQTGYKTISSFKQVQIKRVIVETLKSVRSFVYDFAFLRANSNFTAGGYFDSGDKIFIIDRNDLPRDWVMDQDQYLIYNSIRFTIKEIFDDIDNPLIIIGKHLSKEKLIIGVEPINSLLLSQSVTGEL